MKTKVNPIGKGLIEVEVTGYGLDTSFSRAIDPLATKKANQYAQSHFPYGRGYKRIKVIKKDGYIDPIRGRVMVYQIKYLKK